MEYEKLVEVNEKLGTTKIKGKPYVMVNDIVQGFRELYPEGCIETEILEYVEGAYCSVIARCYKTEESTRPLATGHAQETVDKNPVNRTSMLENAETSAVGRCLGFLGIGSVESIASADEMNKALNREANLNQIIGNEKAEQLLDLITVNGKSPDYICKFHKVNTLAELTHGQFDEVVRYLKKQ